MPNQPSTIGEAIDAFLAETRGKRNSIYGALRQMQRPTDEGGLGKIPLDELDPEQLRAWLAAMPTTTRTQYEDYRRRGHVLRQKTGWAVRWREPDPLRPGKTVPRQKGGFPTRHDAERWLRG